MSALRVLAWAGLLAAPAWGGGEDGVVLLKNLRIIPVGKEEIATGSILIKGGKIAEVGRDVKAPAGSKVVDAKGLVAFPGLVHPYTRLGTSGSGGGGSSAPTPHHRAADEINAALEIYPRLARAGVTTLGVAPSGGSIAGQGAAIKPSGGTREEMLVEASAFLKISMRANTATKDALRQAFDAARKAIEAEKKPPPKPAPGAAAPAPPAKPDEKTAVVMRFLKGELPAMVAVSSAAEILHFAQVLEGFAEFKTRIVYVAAADAYKAADMLGERRARVILRPDVSFLPQTRDRVNPAAELARAGARVALAPDADTPAALEGYLFRVSELVKYGFDREEALRSVTLTPAEFLGLEKRVGSIEAGKDADLLLMDGDPLGSQTRIRQVYLNGRPVFDGE